MRVTVQEWKAMPKIVLPWKGVETGFTLTEAQGHCGDCGIPLSQMRGDIYEVSGVIEMKLAGVCSKCHHLVPCRSRVYPKTGVFAQERDGKWLRFRMATKQQRRISQMMRFIRPFLMWFILTILLVCFVASPSKWIWMCWGLILFVVVVVAAVMTWGRKGD